MASLTRRIYDHSPAWLQSVWISAYGWNVRRIRWGPEFERLSSAFETQEWLSRDEVERFQSEKLAEVVKHAYETVPYYHDVMNEHKLTPDDIQSVADLHKMPVLPKAILKTRPDLLRSRSFSKKDLFYGETSGTTGDPLGIYWDRNMVITNAVVEWRQKRWAGLSPGDPIAVLMISRTVVPPQQTKPPFWRYNRPMNQMLMSALHLRDDCLAYYVEAMERFGAVALEAYPSTAFQLARYLRERGEGLNLRCVLTTSEMLTPAQRETIGSAFECEVFDYYGMAERIVFATECSEHNGMHLNSDYGITEVLDDDGQPTEPGTAGQLYATNLHNLAMPLIRCETTDRISVNVDTCRCGRAFPLIGEFEGRMDDQITLPDGRKISPTALTVATDPLYQIAATQLIQENHLHLVVKVVRGEGYSAAVTKELRQNLIDLLGNDMNIEIEFVAEIERSRGGKHRWVVSNIA